MSTTALPLLPLGTSNFTALRLRRQIYVDKTSMLFNLASKPEKFFLSRPRRFGKSLLVSTFESLFKHGLRDFQGLAIEKLWKEESPYKTLRFDFSSLKGYSSVEQFQKDLDDYLSDLMFREHMEIPNATTGLRAFVNWLSVQPPSSVVILIDEYDAPLTACLNDPELFNSIRNCLSRFYAQIKEWDGAIRFLFMTGITKFNKTSIFSELNTLTDISLIDEYGTLLGYTRDEVERYFGGYLDKASTLLDMSRSELMETLARKYDGFCFSTDPNQKVFAPWSLLKFMSYPAQGFRNYWFESGGRPSALMQFMKSHSLGNPESYSKEQNISLDTLSNSSDLEGLTDVGLLTQAGYLTIRKVIGSTAYLDYPNEEVRTSMARLYMEQLLKGKTVEQVGAEDIAGRLALESVENVVGLFDRLFGAIDYQNYPVRDEASLRAFVQAFLSGAGLNPMTETHNAKGRSDLEVKAGSRHWVFEFKVARRADQNDTLLQEALDQIRTRRYGEAHTGGELIRLALVFSVEERKFVRWSLCPAGTA